MKKTTVRLSDKAQSFVESKAVELGISESDIINDVLEKRSNVEKMNAAKAAKNATPPGTEE